MEDKQMLPKFWLVWRVNNHSGPPTYSSPPTFRHDTEASARTEAARLAVQCPGQHFAVLECIGVCVKSEVTWHDVSDDPGEFSIPF